MMTFAVLTVHFSLRMLHVSFCLFTRPAQDQHILYTFLGLYVSVYKQMILVTSG